MPKMRHPQSKQTIDVAPTAVAMYESQGWQVKAPTKKTSARTSTAADAATKE